ncbi:baseplate J/gp47 family protein [Bacillus cereus]|nr:baseplate J/gp47 family protein [Bacillus cereus]MEB9190563.1 baseplate J/gp47 family protein [Bacillus cereus]
MQFKGMMNIYSRLVDYTITNTNKLNDFSVGSAIRALYEAVAMEVEQFYVLTEENLEEAIQAGVYESFGFKRKAPQRAYGRVRITFHNAVQQNLPLPRGTRFTSSFPEYANIYETVEDYYIPAGAVTAEVFVYCLTSGEVGNVPANAIDVMMTPLSNVKLVTNPAAFQTGENEEPLEALKARFRSYIESLSKATKPALEYGTRLVPEVAGVYIDEKIGLVVIYAHDKNGELPDSVKLAIETSLSRFKPAGIPVEVKPVTRKSIDVDVTITIANKPAITTALRDRIKFAIEGYLNNMQTSQNLILNDLSYVIKSVDKQLVYDIQYTTPTTNQVVKGSEIVRAGIIKVTLV